MNTRDLVKLAAEALGEDHWWEFADRLLDEVPSPRGGTPPGGKSSANDGSHVLLDELSREIEKETGHRFTVNRLRQLRATAAAWPPGDRDHEVEFAVHERLRSPHAKGKLRMYKRKALADYKRSPSLQGSPRLTEHRLRVYRAEERPMTPWDVQMHTAARRFVRKADTQEALDELERVFKAAVKARRAELNGDT